MSPDPESDGAAATAALDAVLDAFEARWRRGERPRAEEYLDRLAGPAEAVALVVHEACLARGAGEVVDAAAYQARFPALAGRLGALLGPADPTLEPAPGSTGGPAWPEADDALGPYHLLRELGRGAFGRVFLAEQGDLGDRLVVVKVTTRPGPEPELMARARHPHIAEVLVRRATAAASDRPQDRLHLVVMPYLGGATLDRVLAAAARRRRGRDWLAALDRAAAPEEAALRRAGPSRAVLGRLDGPRAVAWVGARLADALAAAHARRIIHGDVKPSNVLLAGDGTPLLLDFNLAGAAGEQAGGTPAALPPERLRELAGLPPAAEPPSAVGPGSSTIGSADRTSRAARSSDLYGLGLVLVQMLAGGASALTADGVGVEEMARRRADPRRVRDATRARGIPAALGAVLTRCLEPDPADRYGRAEELAEDLDRIAAGGGALARWRAVPGHRRAAAVAAALVVALVGAAAAVEAARRGVDRERARARLAALWDGRTAGVFRLGRLGSWRGDDPRTTAAESAALLARFDLFDGTRWRDRPEARSLAGDERAELEVWLLGLAYRYARAVIERDPEGPPAEERARARAALGADPAWAALPPVAALRARLDDATAPAAPEAGPAVAVSEAEAYLRGLEAEPRQPRRAREWYARAVAIRPGALWARYRLACCAVRLGRFAEAVEQLDRCLARLPDNPALLVQRAGCLQALGRTAAAERDCARALAESPELFAPFRTLALVRGGRGQAEAGLAELRRYARRLPGDASLATWDAEIALMVALEGRAGVVPPEPPPGVAADDPAAHALRGYLLEADGRPAEALVAYDAALAGEPDHLWARFRRAELRRRLGRPGDREDLERLVADPRFEELVAQSPAAIEAYRRLVDAWLLEEDEGAALAGADRAVAVATWSGRDEALALARYGHARVLRHLANQHPPKALRRLAATMGLPDPVPSAPPGRRDAALRRAAADRALDELRAAWRGHPARVERLLATDRVFLRWWYSIPWLPHPYDDDIKSGRRSFRAGPVFEMLRRPDDVVRPPPPARLTS